MAKRWTEEEVLKLRELISEGLTHAEIGGILNRSTGAIKSKCCKLGIKIHIKWTEVEVLKLRKLVSEELTYAEICGILNRSISAITQKCWELGIKSLNNTLKTTDQYKQDLPSDITVIDKYINARDKIYHQCNICNTIWEVRPTDILSGCGCPTCANIKLVLHFDKDESVKEQALLVKDYLYIMQCDSCLKVGVSISPSRRLSQIKHSSADQSWHLIHTLETNAWDAYILESKIRKCFKRYPSTNKWGGHTELYYTSDLDKILELISLDSIS